MCDKLVTSSARSCEFLIVRGNSFGPNRIEICAPPQTGDDILGIGCGPCPLEQSIVSASLNFRLQQIQGDVDRRPAAPRRHSIGEAIWIGKIAQQGAAASVWDSNLDDIPGLVQQPSALRD